MKYLIALFAGLGAALIAHVAGVAIFNMLYDIAWARDLDPWMDNARHLFVTLPAAIAFVACAWFALRQGAGDVRSTTVAVFSGLGGAWTGYLLADAYAFEFWHAFGWDGIDLKDMLILSLISWAAVLAIVAVLLTLVFHGHRRSARTVVGLFVIAAISGLTALFVAAATNKAFAETRYGRGVNVVARFEMKIPASAPIALEKDGKLRVDLVADREERQAFFYEKVSRTEGAHQIVEGAVWMVKPTTQRTLVLSIAGEPKRVVRLDLPAKPKEADEFGPWQRLEVKDAAAQASAVTESAYEIRYRAN